MKGAALLSVGKLVGYGLSFIRNLILARVLAKADYGLAAAFAMAVMLLEFAGSMSVGVQLVQSKQGNDERFQGAAHSFQFLMALIGSSIMLIVAFPMAAAFKVPQLGWAFMLLAVVPFLRGFEHLDRDRLQRELNYLPGVLCEVVPQFVVTLATWPLTIWLPDYRVILILMVAKSVLTILTSHLLAHRRYRWHWNREIIKTMFSFGWPMLMSGFLIFGSQQGLQVLVGAFFSLSDLAEFSLAAALVSIPIMLFSSVSGSLMLPVLSRCQDDQAAFGRQYLRCMELSGLLVGALLFPLMMVGEQFITILYGSKYQGSGVFVTVLGAVSAFRLLRITPTIAATARADTLNNMYSNVWRCAGLPLALLFAAMGAPILWIAASGLVGELGAVVFSLARLSRLHEVSFRMSSPTLAFVVLGISTVVLVQWCGDWHLSLGGAALGLLILMLVSTIGAVWLLPTGVGVIREGIGRIVSGRPSFLLKRNS